jgi:hypothetical protein
MTCSLQAGGSTSELSAADAWRRAAADDGCTYGLLRGDIRRLQYSLENKTGRRPRIPYLIVRNNTIRSRGPKRLNLSRLHDTVTLGRELALAARLDPPRQFFLNVLP